MPNAEDLDYSSYHDHLPTPPPTKNNLWFWILIVVVVIVILGIISYFIFTKDKSGDPELKTNIELDLPGTKAGNSP